MPQNPNICSVDFKIGANQTGGYGGTDLLGACDHMQHFVLAKD